MSYINTVSFYAVEQIAAGTSHHQNTIQIIRDQIRRGLDCLVTFTQVTETENGWSTPDRLIVGITSLVEGGPVVIDLRDPNPAYDECDSPFEALYLVDLNEHGFVDDEIIEAIADHIIDHQNRFSSPCENHPDDRCTDCHLRPQPCFTSNGGE